MLATDFDEYDSKTFFSHAHRCYVWSVLGPDELVSAFKHTPNNSSYLGKLLLAYQMLDTLLWVVEFPKHPHHVSQEQRNIPAMTERLDAVIRHLKSFVPPTIVKPGHAITYVEPVGSSSQAIQLYEDSPAARSFRISISNVARSQSHLHQKMFHTIMQHVHSVASLIRWFHPVRFTSVRYFRRVVNCYLELHDLVRKQRHNRRHSGVFTFFIYLMWLSD
jgi:hypothetical protein